MDAVAVALPADAMVGLWALVKIAAVFAVMAALVRRGMEIGYVLLLSAVLLGFALGVGFADARAAGLGWAVRGTGNLVVALFDAVTEAGSLRLLALVLTITVFGAVLKRVEKLRELADSLLALLRDRRWAMGWLASLIGLLPMPGGAMVSAPMVGEVAGPADLTPEEKTAINHWMRHVWEYVDPLYPGLLTAAFVLKVSVVALVVAQLPLCLAAIAGGVVFLLRLVPHHQRRVGDEAGRRSLWPVLKATGPVLIVIVAALLPQLVAVLAEARPGATAFLPGGARWLQKDFVRPVTEFSMLVALSCLIAGMLIGGGVSRAESWRIIRGGVTLRMTALVLGVSAMKGVLEASGKLSAVAEFLRSTGLPAPVVIGAVVFTSGMLLGYTYGFVAVSYPILAPLMTFPDGSVNYPLAAFAFGLGFLGVLLSPVHLCLVLSREHFGARWGGVYRKLAAPSLVVLLTAVLMLLWA